MIKNEFTFEILIPEQFNGNLDIRVGFHNGRITGKPSILDAKMFLNATVKVKETGEKPFEKLPEVKKSDIRRRDY